MAESVIGLTVFIGLIVLVAITLAVIARLALGPIIGLARIKAPTRFLLSDFVWLLVLLQAALAICVRFSSIDAAVSYVILGGLVCAFTAIWVGAVSFLSSAGVRSPLRRAAFVLFVLPMTLAYMITLPFAVLAGIFNGLERLRQIRTSQLELSAGDVAEGAAIAVGVILGFTILGWFLRRVSFWVASDSS